MEGQNMFANSMRLNCSDATTEMRLPSKGYSFVSQPCMCFVFLVQVSLLVALKENSFHCSDDDTPFALKCAAMAASHRRTAHRQREREFKSQKYVVGFRNVSPTLQTGSLTSYFEGPGITIRYGVVVRVWTYSTHTMWDCTTYYICHSVQHSEPVLLFSCSVFTPTGSLSRRAGSEVV